MPRREFEIIWDLGTCKVEDLSSYATTLGPVGILLRLPGKEHPQIVCALHVDLVFGSSLKPGFAAAARCCILAVPSILPALSQPWLPYVLVSSALQPGSANCHPSS